MVDALQVKKSVYVLASHPYFINYHCLHQINSLARKYEVTLFCDLSPASLTEGLSSFVTVKDYRFGRRPSIFRDLLMTLRLVWVFVSHKPDVVHSFSPKVGCIAMVSARVAGIKKRVHFFTGQVWVTEKGCLRWLYRTLDRLTATNATHLLTDSPAQSQFLIDQGIVSPDKNITMGDGSVGGVDQQKFCPNPLFGASLRFELGIGVETTVFLFLGRLSKDKGIEVLITQIGRLFESGKDVHLILAGPEEGIDVTHYANLNSKPDFLTCLGEVKSPERVINASDVLCLVSAREGFGKVVIEAASCGIPSIVSDIYGLKDSVVPNETGLVVELDNEFQVGKAMIVMCDKALRGRLGNAARERVIAQFSSERMTQLWLDYYEQLLREE